MDDPNKRHNLLVRYLNSYVYCQSEGKWDETIL